MWVMGAGSPGVTGSSVLSAVLERKLLIKRVKMEEVLATVRDLAALEGLDGGRGDRGVRVVAEGGVGEVDGQGGELGHRKRYLEGHGRAVEKGGKGWKGNEWKVLYQEKDLSAVI